MKRYLLIIMLLLHFINADAQAWIYHPMPGSNAVWRNQYTDVLPNMTLCTDDYQYRLSGDTVIGTHTYTKVIYEGMDNCNFNSGGWNSYFKAGIRNDTLNKKVYRNNGSGDQLLYDFSLNVGDAASPMCDDTIATIDSVLVGSNYRKRFITNHSYHIIEGIGKVGQSGTGNYAELFFPYCGATLSPTINFVCYFHNSDIYPSTTSSCPVLVNTVGISEINETNDNISISPNPIFSQGIIELGNKSDTMREINIYNVLGECLHHQPITSNQQLTLDVSSLANGVYFVEVQSEKGVLRKKFVKE